MMIGPSSPLPPSVPVSSPTGVAAGREADDRDADGRDLTGRQQPPPKKADDPAPDDEPAPLTTLDVRV